MAVVLSHGSALRVLRLQGWALGDVSHALCPEFRLESSPSEHAGCADGASELCLDRPEAAQIAALLHANHPMAPADEPVPLFGPVLDILCHKASQRSRAAGVQSHVWGRPLSLLAVAPIQDGLFCSSASLCYLQLASSCEIAELALLGCELMGTYAPCDFATFGLMARDPLMTPASLQCFLDTCGPVNGLARAREALGYLLPRSASPMESRVALYLTLPRRLGGYGLPKPDLNLRFGVDGKAREITDKHFFRGDLCWKDAGIALEYDSDAAHTGPDRIAADTKRRNALAYLGITVLGITRKQAFDVGEFDRVARTLAKLLDIPMRERRVDQRERRALLHRRLFGRDSFR